MNNRNKLVANKLFRDNSQPEALVAFGVIAVVFAVVLATALGHVGEYQLNAMYNCKIGYTEVEHQRWCRNENDGFGNLHDGGQYPRRWTTQAQ